VVVISVKLEKLIEYMLHSPGTPVREAEMHLFGLSRVLLGAAPWL